MIQPIVTELPRRLEPTTHDTFLDGEPAPAPRRERPRRRRTRSIAGAAAAAMTLALPAAALASDADMFDQKAGSGPAARPTTS